MSGIFIKNIIAGSPAEKCKQIKIGDRILSVNETDVTQATQEETINLIKNAGCSIALVLQSFDGTNVSLNKSQEIFKYHIKTCVWFRNLIMVQLRIVKTSKLGKILQYRRVPVPRSTKPCPINKMKHLHLDQLWSLYRSRAQPVTIRRLMMMTTRRLLVKCSLKPVTRYRILPIA